MSALTALAWCGAAITICIVAVVAYAALRKPDA